jgi:hypothetical protein
LNLASDSNVSSTTIRNQLALTVTPQTVRNILRQCPYLCYEKRRKIDVLTNDQKTRRRVFAREHMSWTKRWRYVVFSDEKKFNLDGPDGLQYYWHDLRKNPQDFSSLRQPKGSFMIWGAFGYFDKAPLHFLEGTITSESYEALLENYDLNDLLPIAAVKRGKRVIFQQDNARPHSSASTKTWLKTKDITVLDWPAKSCDINPMENLWGILVRSVYANGRSFNTCADLKAQIERSWEEIPTETLRTLVNSMPNRIHDIISGQGERINY